MQLISFAYAGNTQITLTGCCMKSRVQRAVEVRLDNDNSDVQEELLIYVYSLHGSRHYRDVAVFPVRCWEGTYLGQRLKSSLMQQIRSFL